MKRAFMAGLLGLALAACTSTSATQRYSGTWEWHFETNAFVTDSGEGPYWLVGEGSTWEQLGAPFQQTGHPWGRQHIIVEGWLSEPGRYGHLGAYERELHVTRVIETRLISASDQPSGS
jgi:hypothetical protein